MQIIYGCIKKPTGENRCELGKKRGRSVIPLTVASRHERDCLLIVLVSFCGSFVFQLRPCHLFKLVF